MLLCITEKNCFFVNFIQNKLVFKKETIFNLVLGTIAKNGTFNFKKLMLSIAEYCV